MPRVVAGKNRGTILTAPKGNDTRPTTDKVKEALFSSIQHHIPDALFLDLFSGTGQMGIEAVSRGAEKAILVEQNRGACDIIRKNIEKTHNESQVKLIMMNVDSALDRLHDEKQTFDVIFMDPPYRIASDMAERVSKKIRDYGLLAKDGLFIVEHASEEALSHNVINLTFSRCCKYGATMLTFFIE